MFKEFKDFAVKGNVIELGIAVVFGAAFGNDSQCLCSTKSFSVAELTFAFISGFDDFKCIVLPYLDYLMEKKSRFLSRIFFIFNCSYFKMD